MATCAESNPPQPQPPRRIRLASSQVIAQQIGFAHQDLDQAAQLWDFVAEQKLLGDVYGQVVCLPSGHFTISGLPTGDAGEDELGKTPMPSTSRDWVGEQVATGHRHSERCDHPCAITVERDDRRAELQLLDAIARLGKAVTQVNNGRAAAEDAIRRIRAARVALGAQVPAIDAALRAYDEDTDHRVGIGPDGRTGTSGVSLEEADRQRKGAVEAEDACAVCDLGVSEVGRLKLGMCPTHYQAWWREGRPQIDRHEWVVDQRHQLGLPVSDNDHDGAEIVVLRPGSPYKTMRHVA